MAKRVQSGNYQAAIRTVTLTGLTGGENLALFGSDAVGNLSRLKNTAVDAAIAAAQQGGRAELEALDRLLELYEAGDMAGAAAALAGFEIPLLLLAAYEILMLGGAIVGVVLIVKKARKLRLQPGLLPPPREGRVANVFLNGGVAAALAVFALTFVLSLL